MKYPCNMIKGWAGAFPNKEEETTKNQAHCYKALCIKDANIKIY